MPIRGGRSGSGSRAPRASAPRSSSGGSKGFRVNVGNQGPRATSSTSDTNSNPTYRRPFLRPRTYGQSGSGMGWKTIALIVGVIFLGICACAAALIALQTFG